MNMIRKMWNDNEGQDLIEYALIAGLLALVTVGAMTLLGTSISGLWTRLQTTVSGL